MPEAAPQSASPALAEFKPHVFGKFFLLQRLAVGGMAEIFRSKVLGTGGFEKELVVKRILPARAQDQGFIHMLVNEAKLTVQLTHNNIAQIYECGSIDDNFFIAMELVNGVSIKDMQQAFPRTGQQVGAEAAIFTVLQLLQGLDYAHKKTDTQGQPLNIVHCDVSPDNVLVSWEGEVKLTDFGIARAATGLSNYKEGMLMGKLGYVAPEQASLEAKWDHRVDVFASGIILYELLTKNKPFAKATDVETLIQVRRGKVAPPSSFNEKLPKEVDFIVAKALAYDPEKRFKDAREFAEALVDVLFPTPQSAVQDLLARQMQLVYAEKIQKMRAARTHDPLVMKVLINAAEQQQASYQRFTESKSMVAPAPGQGPAQPPAAAASMADLPPDHRFDLAMEGPRSGEFSGSHGTSRTPAGLRKPASDLIRVREEVIPWGKTLSLGAVTGLVVAAGLYAAQPWLRSGVVVVQSTPPGASVKIDGDIVLESTPAVIDGIVLAKAHTVEISAPDYRTEVVQLAPEPSKLVRTVEVKLAPSIGALTVESEPAGARVRFDDKDVGETPVTLEKVHLDERHRIDLTHPGYEIDQFVVLPEKDGQRFERKLSPAHKKRHESEN